MRGTQSILISAVRSFERVISDQHTIIKMDIEGSELALLARPRAWQRVRRVLVFEFSAACCRHFGVGPLPFVSVLEAFRRGGFTHLSIPCLQRSESQISGDPTRMKSTSISWRGVIVSKLIPRMTSSAVVQGRK